MGRDRISSDPRLLTGWLRRIKGSRTCCRASCERQPLWKRRMQVGQSTSRAASPEGAGPFAGLCKPPSSPTP